MWASPPAEVVDDAQGGNDAQDHTDYNRLDSQHEDTEEAEEPNYDRRDMPNESSVILCLNTTALVS